MIKRPRPIQTDASNPFANRTLRERLPAILRETRALNPDYSPRIHDSIQRLHDELVGDAKIRLIETPAPRLRRLGGGLVPVPRSDLAALASGSSPRSITIVC